MLVLLQWRAAGYLRAKTATKIKYILRIVTCNDSDSRKVLGGMVENITVSLVEHERH